MEVIYPTNTMTAKQKNKLETLLMPFSIMYRIMFIEQLQYLKLFFLAISGVMFCIASGVHQQYRNTIKRLGST